jgi:hypothetical protein
MGDNSQIVEIKLADGRVIAFVDWTDRPQFSTVEILSGTNTQEMSLFQYTAGDPVPAFAPVAIANQRTATELDTNMANPGAMADTEELMVYAIRPEVFRRHVTDEDAPDFSAPAALSNGEPAPTPLMLSVMALRLLMTLEISQKKYAMAGFGYYNFGAGMLAPSAEGTIANYGFAGLPSQQAVRTNVVPQHIGGQEKFRLLLNYSDDGTGQGIELGELGIEGGEEGGIDDARFARVRVYLDGLYKRPTS